jgi:hypothetical protein
VKLWVERDPRAWAIQGPPVSVGSSPSHMTVTKNARWRRQEPRRIAVGLASSMVRPCLVRRPHGWDPASPSRRAGARHAGVASLRTSRGRRSAFFGACNLRTVRWVRVERRSGSRLPHTLGWRQACPHPRQSPRARGVNQRDAGIALAAQQENADDAETNDREGSQGQACRQGAEHPGGFRSRQQVAQGG